MVVRPGCTLHHLGLANALGEGQDDVPGLLRRAADAVERLGDVDVHDIILHTELVKGEPWHSLTVYYVTDTPTS